MKIGILIDEILPGGVQKAAIEETRYLRKMGHQSELISVRKSSGGYRYEDIVENVPIKFLSDGFPILNYSLRFPIFNFFSTHHITSCIIAPLLKLWNDFDIIVSHGLFASAIVWSASVSNEKRYLSFMWDPASYLIKKVYSKKFHFAKPLFSKLIIPLERTIINGATFILTPSRVHLKTLRNEYHIDERKIKVIYPGCYPIAKIPEKRGRYLLSFTRWDVTKKPYFLIELVKRLPHAKLILAGEWTSKADYQLFLWTIKREKVSDRVVIIPRLKKSNILELCSKARVWVYPNFEAFGMSALEAAACGCPIIMPRGSGVTELFHDEVGGFFPKEGDIEAYIQHVSELLSNERLAWRMGYQAWETAKSYTWENHTRILCNVLQNL